MKNKRFITLCLVLILITTFCIITIHIIKAQDKETPITSDFLNGKIFVNIEKDETNESKETISFANNEVKKTIIIKSNDDTIDDITNEVTYSFAVKKETNEIYIRKNSLTLIYKYKNNCIYDVDNKNIKYCIEKDA